MVKWNTRGLGGVDKRLTLLSDEHHAQYDADEERSRLDHNVCIETAYR